MLFLSRKLDQILSISLEFRTSCRSRCLRDWSSGRCLRCLRVPDSFGSNRSRKRQKDRGRPQGLSRRSWRLSVGRSCCHTLVRDCTLHSIELASYLRGNKGRRTASTRNSIRSRIVRNRMSKGRLLQIGSCNILQCGSLITTRIHPVPTAL